MPVWTLPKVSPVRVWHRVKAMSKRAAADLRWALMQATDCVRRYDPYFGDYYANREGEDKKHHCLALASVARKLMGVCLARPWETTPPRHHQPEHLQEGGK